MRNGTRGEYKLEDTVKTSLKGLRWQFGVIWAAGVVACFLIPATARADLIVSVQSVSAAVGSSDNGIDVELTNNGATDLTIAGFSFGISIANSDISFTDANTSTIEPYIFDGNSLFGPDLTGPTSGQSLSTSDAYSGFNSGATLDAGATLGLGHVLFDVSPGAASGVFPVDLAVFPTTSLADESGNNIPIDKLVSGSITITGPTSPVPEPSSMLLLLSCVAVLSAVAGYRRTTRSRKLPPLESG